MNIIPLDIDHTPLSTATILVKVPQSTIDQFLHDGGGNFWVAINDANLRYYPNVYDTLGSLVYSGWDHSVELTTHNLDEKSLSFVMQNLADFYTMEAPNGFSQPCYWNIYWMADGGYNGSFNSEPFLFEMPAFMEI